MANGLGQDFHAVSAAAQSEGREAASLRVLQGILTGMTCDRLLTEPEVLFLKDWLESYADIRLGHPYSTLYDSIAACLADGVLTAQELDSLCVLWGQMAVGAEEPAVAPSLDRELLLCYSQRAPLQSALLAIVRHKDLRESDWYRRAHVSKQSFHDIYGGNRKTVGCGIAYALALAAELSYHQTLLFLRIAGCASGATAFDADVLHCIRAGNYDLDAVNAQLWEAHGRTLGSKSSGLA